MSEISTKGLCHVGEVVGVESHTENNDGEKSVTIKVLINRVAACDGCHAKGSCFTSSEVESERRILSVESNSDEGFSVGDRVEVSINYRVGLIATLTAYVAPLLLFVVAIVVGVTMGVEEGIAAAVAFAVTALYYGVIYLLKGRFTKIVKFSLRKVE